MNAHIVMAGLCAFALMAGSAPAFAKKKKKKDDEKALKAPPLMRPGGQSQRGLKDIMGQNARELASVFGPPDQDVREDTARKLQWTSDFCVLDAYLYPPADGQVAIVTYVSARVPDGRTADAASCVMALQQR